MKIQLFLVLQRLLLGGEESEASLDGAGRRLHWCVSSSQLVWVVVSAGVGRRLRWCGSSSPLMWVVVSAGVQEGGL